MVKNNFLAVLTHICIVFITFILYFLFYKTEIYNENGAGKTVVYVILLLLAFFLYVISTKLLKPMSSFIKNILSVILPSITGVAVYLVNALYFNEIFKNGLEYVVYKAYNMPFVPLQDAIYNIFVYKMYNYKIYHFFMIILSFLPTLLMFAGLQVQTVRMKRRLKSEKHNYTEESII